MDESELKEVLRLHKLWLEGDDSGRRADLHGEDLSGADLRKVDLRNANLEGTNLYRTDLRWSDLSGADLRNAVLRYANLEGTNLYEADMRDVNLSEACLYVANLRGAKLNRASLHYADLRGASLQRAILLDADLYMVELGYSAYFARATGVPIYQVTRGFGSRNDTLTLLAQGRRDSWKWFTGCFKGSEDKLRKAVAFKHGGTPEERRYLRAIDYLIAQAEDNTNSQQQS